jgi:hypothetical protein
MREIRPSGSVRGVRRKPYPYRDRLTSDAKQRSLALCSACQLHPRRRACGFVGRVQRVPSEAANPSGNAKTTSRRDLLERYKWEQTLAREAMPGRRLRCCQICSAGNLSLSVEVSVSTETAI